MVIIKILLFQFLRSLEAALQRYGGQAASFKAPAATVLDAAGGKTANTLTYAKLLSRAQKIASALTTKQVRNFFN